MLKSESNTDCTGGWPHEVVIDLDRTQDIIAVQHWCEQQFGPQWHVFTDQPGAWSIIWKGQGSASRPYRYRCLFRHSQDAVLFSLRWS